MMADNERIDTLIAHLLMYPERHRQVHWLEDDSRPGAEGRTAFLRQDCGTTACAGGWAETLFGDPGRWGLHHSVETARLLGLRPCQARFVFFGTLGYADPEEAAILALKYVKDHPGATAQELGRHVLGEEG